MKKKYNEYVTEGEVTKITLDKGQVAFVESVDLALVRHYCWYARPEPSTGKYYVVTNIYREDGSHGTLFIHVLIMGEIEGKMIDHRDGNTLDNRRTNLRHVTHSENEQNRTKVNRNTSTGIRGVSRWRHRGQLKVTATANRKVYHGGYFPDTPEGLCAADEAAIALRLRVHTHSDGR